MTTVRPMVLPTTAAKAGYDNLDPISQWHLGGSATAGAEATGLDDDDRYGLDLLNVGSGGLSFRATSGNAANQIKVDNTGVSIAGLSIAGAVTFTSVTVTGTLSVTGASTFGAATVGGALNVTGAATFGTAVTMNSTLNVTGGVVLHSSLVASGAAQFQDTLAADGNVTLGNGTSNTVLVAGDLTVNRDVSIQRNLDVDGALALGSSTSANFLTLGDWVVTLVGDDLVFKDDAGGEMFRIGDAASTYHAKVTGPLHVSGEIELEGAINHDGTTIGFFGSAPNSKETVTGSRGGNVALGNLLDALSNYGLLVDNTS